MSSTLISDLLGILDEISGGLKHVQEPDLAFGAFTT